KWFELMRKGVSNFFLDEVVYQYRRHEGQATQDQGHSVEIDADRVLLDETIRRKQIRGERITVVIATTYYFGIGGGDLLLQWFNKVLSDAGYDVHVVLFTNQENIPNHPSVHVVKQQYRFFMPAVYERYQAGNKDAGIEFKRWPYNVRKEYEEIFSENIPSVNEIFQKIKPDVVVVCGITGQPAPTMAFLKRFGRCLGYYPTFKLLCHSHVMLAEKKLSNINDIAARLFMSRMFGVFDNSVRRDAVFLHKYLPEHVLKNLFTPMQLVDGWITDSKYMKKRILLADKTKFTSPDQIMSDDEIEVAYSYMDPNLFRPLGKNSAESKRIALDSIKNLDISDSMNGLSKSKVLEILGSKKVVMYLGRIVENKQVHNLLESWAYLNKNHKEEMKDHVLLLVGGGGGPYMDTLHNIIVENNLKGSVIYLGAQENKYVVNFYNICELFVHLSSRDCFPRTLKEAALCEKLVISRNHTGVREAIKLLGGLFIPSRPHTVYDGKFLLKALRIKGAKKTRMIKSSRRKAIKYFSWGGTAPRIVAVFNHFIMPDRK
ncbi:MAG: glycosyltransferase, partial [Nanoarchaeota archaeon]|nr:glycosyltransferase [Nanoarchaeota archaeon]